MDNDLLKMVSSDLKYIFNRWDDKVDDDTLRRNSNILRIQLVENMLLKAWHDIGFKDQPMITSASLDLVEYFLKSENIDVKHIKAALAGGARFMGSKIESFCYLDFQLSEKQSKRQDGSFSYQRTYKLTKYIDSRCMYVDGIPIRRLELIQYVANKLGGAHFDQTRNQVNKLEFKFSLLDKVRETITVLDKNSVFYELLSIGNSLNQSEDIHRLVNQIDQIIGN